MLKKVLLAVSWTALLTGVVFLLSFSAAKQDDAPCTGFDIIIDYQGSDHLITPGMIRSTINDHCGKPLKQTLSDISIENVARHIRAIPCLEKADVFLTIEGRLVARVVQRKPLMLVINRLGQQYYADAKGALMPARFDYPARVIIVNGNITFPYSNKVRLTNVKAQKADLLESHQNLYRAFHIVQQVMADSFLTAQVSQIYINSANEIELSPAFGNHVIMFGDTLRTAEKLEKLKAFYIQGIPRAGWDTYRIINLKYKDQIICTR